MSRPDPQPAPGLAARAAALEVLGAALARRAGLEAALAQPGVLALEPRDRAFVRALALATLRRLGPIDAALQARLKSPPPEKVRDILRLGAAQLFVLGIAPHAAVDASVKLAGKSFKGLVNAVLRGLLREPPDLSDPERLAPAWLLARWRAAYGEADARAIAQAMPKSRRPI